MDPEYHSTDPSGNDAQKNGTVLIIDDKKPIVDMIKQMLKKKGYRAKGYHDPVEALSYIKTDPDACSLIITDMEMPRMSGVHLLKSLKEIRTDMPVILLTGYSNTIDETQARQIGFSAYLKKPISLAEIVKTVDSLLT